MTPEQIKANKNQREFISYLSKVMAAAQSVLTNEELMQATGKSEEWRDGASAMFHTISKMLIPAVQDEVRRLISDTLEAITDRQSGEIIKGIEAVDKAVDEKGVDEAADYLKKFSGPAH